MWAPAQDPSQLQLICSWSGVYPSPKLRWEGGHVHEGTPWKPHVYSSEVTDNLTVTLNHSQLANGQTLKCVAEHILLEKGKEKSCSFILSKYVVENDPEMNGGHTETRHCAGILKEDVHITARRLFVRLRF